MYGTKVFFPFRFGKTGLARKNLAYAKLMHHPSAGIPRIRAVNVPMPPAMHMPSTDICLHVSIYAKYMRASAYLSPHMRAYACQARLSKYEGGKRLLFRTSVYME